MTSSSNKPTTAFWIIGIVALLWNLMGVSAYLQQAYMTAEELAALTAEQNALFENTPAWVTAAFALAVFGGTLGCILLILRKKLSSFLFVISFFSLLGQIIYIVFMSNTLDVYGFEGVIMPLLALPVSAFLIWYSKKMDRQGLLT